MESNPKKISLLKNAKSISGSTLKLIAIVSMFIDHTAHILGPELTFMQTPLFSMGGTDVTIYYIMRKIGRLAFPIFCFLLTEGFTHTKNHKKYALRLLLFAVISEIPFNLMLSDRFFDLAHQNIYFTLLLGLILLCIFENVDGELKKGLLMLGVMMLASILRADYGLKGALLILLIHALRKSPATQAILAYPLLSGGRAAFAAFIPINMYNGQRGFIQSGILKYGFYVFYPVHIVALVLIKFLFLT